VSGFWVFVTPTALDDVARFIRGSALVVDADNAVPDAGHPPGTPPTTGAADEGPHLLATPGAREAIHTTVDQITALYELNRRQSRPTHVLVGSRTDWRKAADVTLAVAALLTSRGVSAAVTRNPARESATAPPPSHQVTDLSAVRRRRHGPAGPATGHSPAETP
jgi:hypothetical protein